MTISVCIATVRATTLGSTIRSIVRQSWTDWELLIVGQGDERALRSAVAEAAGDDPRVRYIHLSVQGKSRALNAAIVASRGEILAFTDDDCEADPRWLEVVATAFAADPALAAIGGSVVAPPRARRGLAYCPAYAAPEMVVDPATGASAEGIHFLGANVALRRTAVQRIGPFDVRLGPGPGKLRPTSEDMDYLWRLKNLGLKMRTTPRSIVYHTSGYRYGFREVAKLRRNYTLGGIYLIAKFVLRGDRAARKRLGEMRTAPLDALRAGDLPRFIRMSVRLAYCLHSYQRCRRALLADTAPPRLRSVGGDGAGALAGRIIRLPAHDGVHTGTPSSYGPADLPARHLAHVR